MQSSQGLTLEGKGEPILYPLSIYNTVDSRGIQKRENGRKAACNFRLRPIPEQWTEAHNDPLQ